MRVISGSAKGRNLRSVPGDVTRPILDRIKENLFNILGNNVRGSTWLDLFAGTGSVGIEALSRGADFCLFVDRDRRAIETINANLQLTDLSRKSEVRRDDSLIFLGNAPGRYTSFEVIFIAPPQYKNLWLHTLEAIDRRPEWLVPSGLAIIQIDPKEYEAPSPSNLIVVDQRKYGRSMLVFFERL